LNNIKKKIGIFLIVTALAMSMLSGVALAARQIGTITNFNVPVSATNESQVPLARTKAVTGRRGVVNLSGTATGSPIITATMRNSNKESRGTTTLRQGERVTFATPNALANFNYWLWLRSTQVPHVPQITHVVISGSWSPDES